MGPVSDSLARSERATICALFDVLGPDHPTLCEGWANRHMAAHLYVREHKPLAGIGIVSSRFAGLHDGAIEKALDHRSYEALVDEVRNGPPLWWKPIDAVANLAEYFVHTEDVRRGGGDLTPRPAEEIGELEDALWDALGRSARLAVRKAKGIGIDLVREDGRVHHVRSTPPDGPGLVTITGRPGEIQLVLMGRTDAAAVEISGPDDALAVLAAADLGI